MPPIISTDDRTMLALAAMTYRGFGEQTESAIEKKLRPWFRKLETDGLGRWELVWGPAAFRAPTSLFDDAMMYVARRVDVPATGTPHYAVAIRGTNPISLFDWVFGDLFVRLKVPWAENLGDSGNLSASSALGLEIVRHLAADRSREIGLATFANELTRGLHKFAETLPELFPDQLLVPGWYREANLLDRLEHLMRGGVQADALLALHDTFIGSVDRIVFDRLRAEIARTPDPGKRLLQFLETVEPNARVSVTGHSKGGALAIVTALWLHEAWAAGKAGEIHCFSFAGPTAGDEKFVEYYDASLVSRTRRIANARDIVPHAWVPSELISLTKYYRELRPAIHALAASIKDLDYRHVAGALVRFEGRSGPHADDLVQEIIHQHLDAYLEYAGLAELGWTAQTIFLGS